MTSKNKKEKTYSKDDLRTLYNYYANSSELSGSSGIELLFYAMYGNDAGPGDYNIFANIVNKHLHKKDGALKELLWAFDGSSIKKEVRAKKKELTKEYTIVFGVATIDGEKYLPKRIKAGGFCFSRVGWDSVAKMLRKHNELDRYFKTFLQTINLADFEIVNSGGQVEFSSDYLRRNVELKLSRNLYYKTTVYACDEEEATFVAEDNFKKVLSAAASTYILFFRDITWTMNGVMKRRSPAMFNGVFIALENESDVLHLLESDEKIIAADQKLLRPRANDNVIIKRYLYVLKHINKKSTDLTPVEEKLLLVSNLLYDSLSARRIQNRQLGLWQVIESGIGWNNCRENDIINSLKAYYDMENPKNFTWSIIGDYILSKRGQYVHHGQTLNRDLYGSYDTALNLYCEYIRAELRILLFLLKGKVSIKNGEDYDLFMKSYGLKKKELKMAKWIANHRTYQIKKRH